MSATNRQAPIRQLRRPRQLNLSNLTTEGLPKSAGSPIINSSPVNGPSILISPTYNLNNNQGNTHNIEANQCLDSSIINTNNNNDNSDFMALVNSAASAAILTSSQNSISTTATISSDELNSNTAIANVPTSHHQPEKVDPLKVLDELETSVNDGHTNPALIQEACNLLKENGIQLDRGPARDQMDLYLNMLRNVCRDNRLDSLSRARILEVIELRAMDWQGTEELTTYYQRKLSDLELNNNNNNNNNNTHSNDASQAINLNKGVFNFTATTTDSRAPFSSVANAFNAHNEPAAAELMKGSARKFSKKVPGKSFVKDEFIIRNSDSGKVMGIKGRRVHLIEELSETVISFQRVSSGAKERLIQITGPSDESIDRAKNLIEDTIKRNASPVPLDSNLFPNVTTNAGGSNINNPNNQQQQQHQHYNTNSEDVFLLPSSSTACIPTTTSQSGITASNLPYIQAVTIGAELLIISSSSANLAQEAKSILERHFNRLQLSCFKFPSSGYEPSESSDSEIFNLTTSAQAPQQQQQQQQLLMDFGDEPVVRPLVARPQTPGLRPAYSLHRQTSFQNSLGLLASTTSPAKELGKSALERSASSGAFPTGRTSLRYLNADFLLDDDLEAVDRGQEKKHPSAAAPSLIAYEREFMFECRKSAISQRLPRAFNAIKATVPDIVRPGRAGEFV